MCTVDMYALICIEGRHRPSNRLMMMMINNLKCFDQFNMKFKEQGFHFVARHRSCTNRVRLYAAVRALTVGYGLVGNQEAFKYTKLKTYTICCVRSHICRLGQLRLIKLELFKSCCCCSQFYNEFQNKTFFDF